MIRVELILDELIGKITDTQVLFESNRVLEGNFGNIDKV